MDFALGMFADNVLDLFLGWLSVALIISISPSRRKVGWFVLVVYIVATIGRQIDAPFVTIGAAVHALAFCVGGCIAYGIKKWRERRQTSP